MQVGLYYDEGGYVETLRRSPRPRAGAPLGLMGRQVAGKEFLDAYLNYCDWQELVALTPDRASGRGLLKYCENHPSSRHKQRKLRLYQVPRFLSEFLVNPPASVLHFPCPADARYAWARQSGKVPSFALCGVTHTLCSLQALDALRSLVTAPWESFDRLICTSRAVFDMVRAVMHDYASYLRERHGGNPQPRIGLEIIPLGVDEQKFRPATSPERDAERSRLGIAADEIAVLFVGRLSHHAKAHPFPMLRGLSLAARETRTKVHLLLSGWASGEAVLNAFRDASRRFAGNVRVSIVDGTLSENRFAVWQAADIFTSLSDNIQETFGLVILEAMASGLPVVATNWNGYRDLVVDGETGILVPTCMVPDATRDAMLSLLIGEVDYDHYLARTNQCVAVDVWAAAQAYAAFLRDPELRQRCGTAGRRRVEQQFAWRHVIRAYEQQWARQELERTSFVRTRGDGQGRLPVTGYPSIDGAFAGYPSQWLWPAASVVSPPDAVARLAELLETPLCNYEPADRSSDPGVLRDILGQAAHPTALLQLAESLCQAGLSDPAARATLAWLLKYDLLRIAK